MRLPGHFRLIPKLEAFGDGRADRRNLGAGGTGRVVGGCFFGTVGMLCM